jgi:protein-S-isoprenylcysteine O-methyltransferase Ste14
MKPPSTIARYGRRGELLVALQVILLCAFVFAPAWNPWLTQDLMTGTASVRRVALAICGLVALVLGGLGFLNLGRNLTPLPYPVAHNRLVTKGVYGLVRHPLYSSQLFAAFGWVCHTLSLSHLILLVLGFLFFDYKAGLEEGWLAQRHPDYADYARRVSKLVPWVY